MINDYKLTKQASILLQKELAPRELFAAPSNSGSSQIFPLPDSPLFGRGTPSMSHTSPERSAAAAGRTGVCYKEQTKCTVEMPNDSVIFSLQ